MGVSVSNIRQVYKDRYVKLFKPHLVPDELYNTQKLKRKEENNNEQSRGKKIRKGYGKKG